MNLLEWLGASWRYICAHTFTTQGKTDTLSTRSGDVGEGKSVKKVLTWAGIAFLIFFIAYRPTAAADVAGSLGDVLRDIASGFGNFFTNLVA